jgi:hypothetical protein
MNADEFYEEFKESLKHLGECFYSKENIEVTLRGSQLVLTGRYSTEVAITLPIHLEPEPEPARYCKTCPRTVQYGNSWCRKCAKAYGQKKKLERDQKIAMQEEFPPIPPKGYSLYD